MAARRPRRHAPTALEDALRLFGPLEFGTVRRLRHWARGRHARLALAEFAAQVQRLRPGDICLDLGANVGEVTLQLARSGATVHAFEPDPLAWEVLRQRLGHVPNVVLHRAAVAAEPGRYRLRRHKNFAKDPLSWTIWSHIVAETAPGFGDDETIDVDVRAFADVIRAIGGSVALVKMDIEGAEFAILREVLANPSRFAIDAIYCETHAGDDAALIEEVAWMRRAVARLDRPHINLDWP